MNSLNRCGFLLSRVLKEQFSSSARLLYSDQFLGIDKFIEARQRTATRLGNMRNSFLERMKNEANSSAPTMVFTEDLKTVIHICEDKPEDIDLCIQMMKKFHKQNSELRFGTFVFGPVAMRLFHYMKKPNHVSEFAKDPELTGFFDQLKSYFIAMDLYFKNGLYQEILHAFEELQSKRLSDTKYPRDPLVLAAGACYKINTPETYKLATDLVSSAREDGVNVLRRAIIFTVALALNQNKFDVALEMLSSIYGLNTTTCNLKLTALAGLDRLQDAFGILRQVTDRDNPAQTRTRSEICQSTLDALKQSVERVNDTESSHIFEQLCRSLKESNSITSQSIDDLVCHPIDFRPFRDGMLYNSRSPFPEQRFRGRDREHFDREDTRPQFPEQRFRGRQREYFDREGDFPERRRRFAGISDEF